MGVFMENLEETEMPLKTVSNIIAVWTLNGINWLFALYGGAFNLLYKIKG